ncbi:hypothetical protein VPH35_005213 [Triticum aestivum]
MIRTENSENFKDKINEVTGVMAAVYGGDPSRRTPQASASALPGRLRSSMCKRSMEKGSMWVTMKRCERSPTLTADSCGVGCRVDGFNNSDVTSCSMCAVSMKCQARLKKMASKGEPVKYRCLVCATDGKRNISTSVLFTFSLLLVRHYVCWMCFALILCLMVIRLPLFSPLVCYDLNYRSNICIFPSCICCMN